MLSSLKPTFAFSSFCGLPVSCYDENISFKAADLTWTNMLFVCATQRMRVDKSVAQFQLNKRKQALQELVHIETSY